MPKQSSGITRATQQIATRVPIPWLDNRRSLDKGKPAERRRRKATGLRPSGDTAAGPRRHLSGSESAALIRCGVRAFPCLSGSSTERSTWAATPMARAQDSAGSLSRFGWLGAAAVLTITSTLRGSLSASTGEVGRSHDTPTPDPDPVTPARAPACALRRSEVAPHIVAGGTCSAGRASLPDRAEGLHSPATSIHQSNGARPHSGRPSARSGHPLSLHIGSRVVAPEHGYAARGRPRPRTLTASGGRRIVGPRERNHQGTRPGGHRGKDVQSLRICALVVVIITVAAALLLRAVPSSGGTAAAANRRCTSPSTATRPRPACRTLQRHARFGGNHGRRHLHRQRDGFSQTLAGFTSTCTT